MTKKTVMIVGLGGIGFRYDYGRNLDTGILTHAKAFYENKNFQIICGVDINEANRIEFAQTFQCKSFSGVEEALTTVSPDIIIVATPTNTHLEVINKILEYVKPEAIVCEKPLAYNLDDANVILSKCKSNNVKLFVNYMRISSNITSMILQKINDNSLQPPFKIIQWYSKGILNSASHFISLFNYLFGQIQSFSLLDEIEGSKIDPDPAFRIKYKNCDVLFVPVQNNNLFHNSFEIIAKNGRLVYERAGEYVKWYPVESMRLYPDYNVFSQSYVEWESDFKIMQQKFAENLYKKISNIDSPICTGEEALSTLETCVKIINSKK